VHRAGTTISCRFTARTAALLLLVSSQVAAQQKPVTPVFPTSPLWTTDLAGTPSGPPVIALERVVVPLTSGLIVAHSLANGEDQWSAPIVASGPLAAGDQTIVVPAGVVIEGVDVTTGRTRWKAETGTLTAPLLVRGGWVIAVADGRIMAFRERDGGLVWRQEIGLVERRPAADGDMLFVALKEGRVVALPLLGGTPIWDVPVAADPSEPFPAGGRLYVQSGGVSGVSVSLHCMHAASGYIEWSYKMGANIAGTVAVDDDNIYMAAMDNQIWTFDRGDGARKRSNDLRYRPIGNPIVIGNGVLVPGRVAALPLYDTRTLKEGSKLTLPDPLLTGAASGFLSTGAAMLAVITTSLGKPYTLRVYGPPPPSLPSLQPLTVLPGSPLTISLPGR
jgi:outer membrane protein assembly factor BamB